MTSAAALYSGLSFQSIATNRNWSYAYHLCRELGVCSDEIAAVLFHFATFKKGFTVGSQLSKIFQSACNRQTDRQTQGHSICLACIASCGKNDTDEFHLTALRYVMYFRFLWMTSCFHTMGPMGKNPAQLTTLGLCL